MGSFVARFLTNSPGLGEDLFFSVLGQLPARWGEVMWGPFYPKWGPSGKYLPAPGIGLLTPLDDIVVTGVIRNTKNYPPPKSYNQNP